MVFAKLYWFFKIFGIIPLVKVPLKCNRKFRFFYKIKECSKFLVSFFVVKGCGCNKNFKTVPVVVSLAEGLV